jgi:hypothetical protein
MIQHTLFVFEGIFFDFCSDRNRNLRFNLLGVHC